MPCSSRCQDLQHLWARALLLFVAALLSLSAAGCTVAETARDTQTPPSRTTEAEAPTDPGVEAEPVPETESDPKAADSELWSARVVRVVDGDTVLVRIAPSGLEERVRLIGVDTPESTTRHEPYGAQAAAYTKQALPPGAAVYLETDAELRDRYGRLLAYLWLEGPSAFDSSGRATFAEAQAHLFNAWLMRDGYAQVMTIPPNVRYADYFLELQREARATELGLWGLETEVSGAASAGTESDAGRGADYIGNRNSMKFHESSCRWVAEMNPANKVPFAKRSEAVEAGYQPCKVCRP